MLLFWVVLLPRTLRAQRPSEYLRPRHAALWVGSSTAAPAGRARYI
jgi:hypothetical protein